MEEGFWVVLRKDGGRRGWRGGVEVVVEGIEVRVGGIKVVVTGKGRGRGGVGVRGLTGKGGGMGGVGLGCDDKEVRGCLRE